MGLIDVDLPAIGEHAERLQQAGAQVSRLDPGHALTVVAEALHGGLAGEAGAAAAASMRQLVPRLGDDVTSLARRRAEAAHQYRATECLVEDSWVGQ